MDHASKIVNSMWIVNVNTSKKSIAHSIALLMSGMVPEFTGSILPPTPMMWIGTFFIMVRQILQLFPQTISLDPASTLRQSFPPLVPIGRVPRAPGRLWDGGLRSDTSGSNRRSRRRMCFPKTGPGTKIQSPKKPGPNSDLHGKTAHIVHHRAKVWLLGWQLEVGVFGPAPAIVRIVLFNCVKLKNMI